MGSLRSPVGPLPASIYWRRRAVLLLLVALVAVLVLWAWNSGDGGTDTAGAEEDDGPAESLGPGGPSPSESLIDERPGGRETSSEEDDEGADDGDGADSGDGAESENGGGDDGAGPGGEPDGGGTAGGGGDAGALPPCDPADVSLALRSAQNTYPLGAEPELVLTAENSASASCRVDLGHRTLTVTVSNSDDEEVWSTATCPSGRASAPTVVPAGGTVSHQVDWDRRRDTGDCDGPAGPPAGAGTYLAEAQLDGFPGAQTSFVLEAD